MSASNTAAIADIYNARAADYDAGSNYNHVRQTKYYLSHLTPYLHPGATLLDLACGTGLLALPAKSLVGASGRVVGVDVSSGMLDVARQKSREQRVDVEWYEHDISDLGALDLGSTRGRGFDIIACAAALVLLPSPSAAVRNWTRVLKPGGRVMTDVHVPDSNIAMAVLSAIGPEVGQSLKWDATQFRSQASLCQVFEEAGLEVERAWESEVFGSREVDVADGESMFEQAVQSPMFAEFGKEGVRDRARMAFVHRLKELGGADGKVREDTRSWMCICRKPSSAN
ncbi:MAG: hypothetical protein M1819_007324 [Sarea resinae]|nr:MAG: hypothetical protein M1819_007324 [Sarea resinae]